jgi:hypothetical protein
MVFKAKMALVVGIGLAAVAGCKGKDKQPAPTAGSAAGSAAAGSAAAGSAAGSAAEGSAAGSAAPAGGSELLVAGQVKAGCFAWSSTKQAAACIVGTSGLGVEVEFSLATVGVAAAKTKLELAPAPEDSGVGAIPHVTPAAAKTANEALARDGFVALAGAPQTVTDKPVDLNGVTFALTSKQTDPGGDNMPPTVKHTLTAKCGGKDVVVHEIAVEGLDLTVGVRAPSADYVIVELGEHVGREGESSDTSRAAVLDVKACKVFKAE